MSNPLSIQASLPIRGSGDSTVSRGGTTPAQPQTQPQTQPASPGKPIPLFVNPSIRFDPSIGIVVIEFHDKTGNITNSIPGQRQLAAYRSHQATLPGEQAPKAPQAGDGKTSTG